MASTLALEPAVDFTSVAGELGLTVQQVSNVTRLLDDGNTVPFITRYRKERTGNLDELQIRQIQQRIGSLRQLAERAHTILRLIEAQGALTPKLKSQIEEAQTLKRLEDLYLPFRPKRKSRGQLARTRGLEPLAEQIWNQDPAVGDLDAAAEKFANPDGEVPTAADALRGAADIIAERISETAEVRDAARDVAWKSGKLRVAGTKSAEEAGQDYRNYFDYAEPVSKIPPHRCLAINRGEKEGHLRVKLEWDEASAKSRGADALRIAGHRFQEFVEACLADALARLLEPSLEREIRRDLTERAETHAVEVFAANLKNLLLQPPFCGKRVLAIDPGFRTGCKVAMLDEYGNCLANDVIYVTGSAEKKAAARGRIAELLSQHGCELIAIGNGTACRECEELISEMIAGDLPHLRYTVVNEAGASIYSTSTIAREEFPDFDATIRGTISIGRRLQDPLSELVKIDPQHIGVGMYQHDVANRRLKESLDQVVESCVNYVGVDLNTASTSLLRYVSGFNQLIARRVVEFRRERGRFTNRRQLLDVPGIGESTFTQAAGFLKIADGENPLDETWIHPESYEVAEKVLDRLSTSPAELGSAKSPPAELQQRLLDLDVNGLARDLSVGAPTCRDILEALARPGRDPRAEFPGPVFKQGILNLEDLQEGMELTGTVLNVVDFGVFVDIGLKDSGLVHISEMAGRYIRSPHEVAAVSDIVTVWVLGVDRERRRVSLTMIKPGTPRHERRKTPSESQQPDARKAKPPAGAAPPAAPPKQERRRTAKPNKPPAKLSSEMKSGEEPLKGFDQLKEFWSRRKD